MSCAALQRLMRDRGTWRRRIALSVLDFTWNTAKSESQPWSGDGAFAISATIRGRPTSEMTPISSTGHSLRALRLGSGRAQDLRSKFASNAMPTAAWPQHTHYEKCEKPNGEKTARIRRNMLPSVLGSKVARCRSPSGLAHLGSRGPGLTHSDSILVC